MAESLAIIGLVSAIVQLVDFGTKIVARLDDFEKAVGSVPEAFRDIHTQLPLLLNNLKKTKEQAKARELDEDAKKAVLAVVDNCQNGLQSLEKILVKSLPAANESISRKIGKAISSVRREKRVQDIAKKLRDNAIYLTQYTVVHIADGGRRLPNPSNMCPFAREDSFVGRKGILEDISRKHKVYKRLAIIGLAGVGYTMLFFTIMYFNLCSSFHESSLWVPCFRFAYRRPRLEHFWHEYLFCRLLDITIQSLRVRSLKPCRFTTRAS